MQGLTGIEKCNLLRQIRKKTCEQNGLEYNESPCPHPNPFCHGTCPRCDAETKRIAMLLKEKKRRGGIVRYPEINK